jgi:hypothetical protein
MGRLVTPLTVGTLLASLLSFALLVTGAPLWLFAIGGFAGLIVIRRYTRMFDAARQSRKDGTPSE